MNLDEAQRQAQNMDGQVWFTLIAPLGNEIRVFWEDPFLGAIMVPDKKGILWKHDIDDRGFSVKNQSLER